MIVLFKIHALLNPGCTFYCYPALYYSWIPITVLGYIHRHDHEWSHTAHTRGISFNEVLIPENAELGPKQVVFPKKQ